MPTSIVRVLELIAHHTTPGTTQYPVPHTGNILTNPPSGLYHIRRTGRILLDSRRHSSTSAATLPWSHQYVYCRPLVGTAVRLPLRTVTLRQAQQYAYKYTSVGPAVHLLLSFRGPSSTSTAVLP